jgi:hypothetical protein
MDDVGFAAAIVDLLELSKNVIDYIRAAKGANEERQKLLEETIATRNLVNVLESKAKEDNWEDTMKVLTAPRGPFEQFRDVLECMESKLKPAEGKLSKLAKSLIWPFVKDEINKYVSRMERIKRLFNLALQNEIKYVQSELGF